MKIVEWILFLIVLTFCVVLLTMSVAIFQVFVVDATEGDTRSWWTLLMGFSCASGALALAWPILLEPLYRWLFKAYEPPKIHMGWPDEYDSRN